MIAKIQEDIIKETYSSSNLTTKKLLADLQKEKESLIQEMQYPSLWLEKIHGYNQKNLDEKKPSQKVQKYNFKKGKWYPFLIEKDIDTFRIYIRERLLGLSGVYIFGCGKHPAYLYIGSSADMGKRLYCHFGYMGIINSFPQRERNSLFLKVRTDKMKFERLSLEAKLIFKLKPKYNRRFIGGDF